MRRRISEFLWGGALCTLLLLCAGPRRATGVDPHELAIDWFSECGCTGMEVESVRPPSDRLPPARVHRSMKVELARTGYSRSQDLSLWM